MPKSYKHLTYGQRCQIEALLKRNILQKDIAETIGASKSALSRELTRNRNQNGLYTAKGAHTKSKKRARHAARNPTKLKSWLEEYIRKKLEIGWSPEQISGRVMLDYRKRISATAIYEYLKRERLRGGKLYLYLRRKGKKKRDYNRKKAGKSLIPNRVDIDSRPEIVAKKLRIGDWEGDTIVGRGHKSGLITLVDRVAKFTIITKISNFKSEGVMCKIKQSLNKLLQNKTHKLHTITFDNGLEFARHLDIKSMFPDVDIYFAKPYKSWQRGLNEHTNGLIREYFPKGTDFNNISDMEVMIVQNKLNNRPRAVLGFKTPEEVFFRCYSKH